LRSGFSSATYWSSSDVGAYAWFLRFYNNLQVAALKYDSGYVRPVRAF
jgi:hypothetical protein